MDSKRCLIGAFYWILTRWNWNCATWGALARKYLQTKKIFYLLNVKCVYFSYRFCFNYGSDCVVSANGFFWVCTPINNELFTKLADNYLNNRLITINRFSPVEINVFILLQWWDCGLHRKGLRTDPVQWSNQSSFLQLSQKDDRLRQEGKTNILRYGKTFVWSSFKTSH